MSRGFTVQEGSLFLKLRRQGEAFSAWYSHDRHRWIKLGRVDATFPQRVEVGVVAVNSSTQMLSAELEMLNVEDPQGSMARDYADRDTEGPPPSPPASRVGPHFRPRRASVLFDSAPKRKSPVRASAPTKTELIGFHW